MRDEVCRGPAAERFGTCCRMCRIFADAAGNSELVRDGFLLWGCREGGCLDRDKQLGTCQRLAALADRRQAKEIVREFVAASGGRNNRPKPVTPDRRGA